MSEKKPALSEDHTKWDAENNPGERGVLKGMHPNISFLEIWIFTHFLLALCLAPRNISSLEDIQHYLDHRVILPVLYHVTSISRLVDQIEDVAILCLELSLSSHDLQIDTHMTTILYLDLPV